MREETGLTVLPGPLLGAVERPGPGGSIIDIRDYAATVTGRTLARPGRRHRRPAGLAPPADVPRLPLTSGLADAPRLMGPALGRRQASVFHTPHLFRQPAAAP